VDALVRQELEQDKNYDYVVFSGGRASNNTYEALSNTLDKYMADFRAANPKVKFLYLVTSGAHNIAVEETFCIDILNNLDKLEEKVEAAGDKLEATMDAAGEKLEEVKAAANEKVEDLMEKVEGGLKGEADPAEEEEEVDDPSIACIK
jgi:hypothetical protein